MSFTHIADWISHTYTYTHTHWVNWQFWRCTVLKVLKVYMQTDSYKQHTHHCSHSTTTCTFAVHALLNTSDSAFEVVFCTCVDMPKKAPKWCPLRTGKITLKYRVQYIIILLISCEYGGALLSSANTNGCPIKKHSHMNFDSSVVLQGMWKSYTMLGYRHCVFDRVQDRSFWFVFKIVCMQM